MFDRLFEHPHALARHRSGPLLEERRRFLEHYASQRMANVTLRCMANFILVIAERLRLADRPDDVITANEIEVEATRWARRGPKSGRRKMIEHASREFKRHALRWLHFMARLQPLAIVRRPGTDQIAKYSEYQCRERGLAASTIESHRRMLHNFFEQLDQNRLQLRTLNVSQIDDLLGKKSGGGECTRHTISTRVSILRPFFRFAERHGWCRQGLASLIVAPRVFKHESLPLGPSWEDVKRLLAAAEGKRPAQVRDRAVLMLMAVYGLRLGEIGALSLEDFDWTREILTIPPGKSRKPRIYPLCRPVGDAILRYLREVRPRSNRREVFLILRSPFIPSAHALQGMVQRRMRALGVTLPRYGPHALRHACATHLLSQGLSLKEIGDHLGHRSSDATCIYAKVNLPALRAVADFSLEDLL